MSARAFIITAFLSISCFLNAYAYPDNLLHKSYAVQFLIVDSIFNVVNKHDSATGLRELTDLEKWAEDKGDGPLSYQLKLKKYSYLSRWWGQQLEASRIENELPGLIKELEEIKMPELEAQALQLMADYYWRNPKTFNKGFQLSLEAYNVYSRFTPEQFPPKYSYLYYLGLCYYRFKDYATALPIFLEAKNTQTKYLHPMTTDLLNTIGLCYRRSGVYDSAEYYFQQAYNLAKQANLTGWAGITGGNLGITYYLEKRYKEAIPLLENDIEIGLAHNKLNDNATNSIAVLGDVYLELNDRKKGLATLLQANQIVVDGAKWNHYELLESIYPRLAKAYAMNGNYQLAFNFEDSARRVSDSSAVEKNALILVSVQQKINLEKRQSDAQKHDREIKIQVLIWAFLLVSITLLLVAIFFVLRNYRNQKKTNALLSHEKKRSEDLLLNILPSEVADELKDKGTAEARYFDHVTVLFTDFVNFTAASEKMNPQQLIDELHTCFKAFDEITGKYNIEKIKTIGDAYLAVCGLPVADPMHAQRVVQAALDINEFMQKRRQRLGDKTFEIRIGIHSGSVVAGIVGVIKFAYDIWGDAVNIAARMEQGGEAGRVNIS
jgi:class 3 adenylate cyclase